MSSDDPYVLTSVDHAATDTSQKFSLPEVDDEVLVGFSGGGSTAAPENAWPTKWYVPPENSGSNAELLPFMEQDLGLVKPDHRGETGLKIDFTPKEDDGDDAAFKFFTPKE